MKVFHISIGKAKFVHESYVKEQFDKKKSTNNLQMSINCVGQWDRVEVKEDQ